MKKYKLLRYLPGVVPGILVDCSSDRAALELRIIPSDYPTWFEEVKEPESREGEGHEHYLLQYCESCNLNGTVTRTLQEKEGCKHKAAATVDNYFMCPECGICHYIKPHPKQKPSEWIEDHLPPSIYGYCTTMANPSNRNNHRLPRRTFF